MKQMAKKTISMILAVMIIVAAMPVYNLAGTYSYAGQEQDYQLEYQSVSPSSINDAIAKFTEAMSKFVSDTSELNTLSSFLTRFGGLTELVSGVIGILQLDGIVMDPTMSKLNKILSEMKNIHDKLNEMNTKLDTIHAELVKIAVRQEEKDRNKTANDMLSYWRTFKTHYIEPFDELINTYEAMIKAGIKDWWEQSSHDGLVVAYTKLDDGPALTYSLNSCSDGIPSLADNGESVDTDSSYIIPAEFIPDTASIVFNVNTYRSEFEAKMAENFIKAADAHKLDANDAFYDAWNALNSAEKSEKAKLYAADILNTLIYHISCKVMSNNDLWVVEVTTAYSEYCSNIVTENSGVDAMLNAIYMTHAFEGDIKEDIEKFCDAMIAQTGLYGQFALSCACQDNMQSIEKREAVQKEFVETIKALSEKKKNAITGHDNFCYITGTNVEFTTLSLKSRTTVKGSKYTVTPFDYSRYDSCENNKWEVDSSDRDYTMMDDVYSQVLYRQFLALKKDGETFASYLNKNGTGIPADYSGNVVTRYAGPTQFDLTEGIVMKCDANCMGKYFNKGDTAAINVGTDSDVEDQYFAVHEKLICDSMSIKDGSLQTNQTAGARALYGEHHSSWFHDEVHFFSTYNSSMCYMDVHYTDQTAETNERAYCVYLMDLRILKLTSSDKLNNKNDDNDPFFAFNSPVFTDGISEAAGPVVTDSQKQITEVKINNKYTYTGESIEPKITVKAGKKTVPASGYDVSYVDNESIGDATYTVTGKGDYSGVISGHFSIVPKGTTFKRIKRNKTTAAVKWVKQSEAMPDAQISGYQIRYSTSKSMKNAVKVNVEGYGKTGIKIKGLKKNKKYYFQIRTYIDEGSFISYSKWSSRKAVK